MPIDWSEDIVLVDLADEPEFTEEMSALFERLKMPSPSGSINESDDISYKRPVPIEAGVLSATPDIVLNFGAVTYVNSSHLASLLRLRKRLTEASRLLVLCGLNDEVSSVMRHTGLDRVFQFAPDTMTALAGVQIEAERRQS